MRGFCPVWFMLELILCWWFLVWDNHVPVSVALKMQFFKCSSAGEENGFDWQSVIWWRKITTVDFRAELLQTITNTAQSLNLCCHLLCSHTYCTCTPSIFSMQVSNRGLWKPNPYMKSHLWKSWRLFPETKKDVWEQCDISLFSVKSKVSCFNSS